MYTKDNFVTLKEQFDTLEKNSVGIIFDSTDTDNPQVYFIGKDTIKVVPKNKLKLLNLKKTGKPHEFKICNRCYILKKDKQDFDVNQTDAKGGKTSRPSCKVCRVDIDGIKLTSAEKKRMKQIEPKILFKCPICEKISIPKVTGNVVIDHDKKNGLAREWLCDSCNTGLGRFGDNIEILKKAIEYIDKYNQNN